MYLGINKRMTLKNLPGVRGTTTPFVYIIGWPDHNAYYLGVRYTNGCHPDDLWTRYFTSSRVVHKMASENGRPPYMEIVGTYDTAKDARNAEHSWLYNNRADLKANFLNLGTGKAIAMTPEVRAKVGEASAKRWKDPEYRENQRLKREGHKMPEASVTKRAAAMSERWKTDPEWVERQMQIKREVINRKTPEERSAEKLRMWEDAPERRAKLAETMMEIHQDPVQHTKRMSGWNTPEAKAKSVAARKANKKPLSDEHREAMRQRARDRWANPEFKAKMTSHLTKLQEARRQCDPTTDPRVITRETAAAIKSDGGTVAEVAEKYGVRKHIVHRIRNGTHWTCR